MTDEWFELNDESMDWFPRAAPDGPPKRTYLVILMTRNQALGLVAFMVWAFMKAWKRAPQS